MSSPIRTERLRDPDRTRADLLAVATQVFAEEGYSGARVDDIAERTRTTKRMIYYYFGGKEALYRAVLEQAYTAIRQAESTLLLDDDLAPVEALRQLAELTYDHHLQHPEFIRLVSIENIHNGEHIRQIQSLKAMSVPMLTRLDALLAAGRAGGQVRAGVDAVDVHLLISSYCVFQVANQHTFGYLFGRNLTAPANRDHLRAMIGDVVVGWLTAR